MTYLLALLAGIAGAVIGYLGGAAVGTAIAVALEMSSFEGASGFFVAFVVGPIWAIAGLVLGMYLALRHYGGFTGFAAIAGRMVLTLAAIGILVTGTILVRLATLDPFANRAKPQLLFEMRFPADISPDKLAATTIELQSGDSGSAAWFERSASNAGDRPAYWGGVEIARRSSSRLLVVRMAGEPDRLFRLAIKPMPEHSDALGAWQRADFIFPAGAERSQPAPANDPFEIRYRVRDPQVEYIRPIVEFELELPAATPLPADHDAIAVTTRFANNAERGSLDKENWRRNEGDRIVLHGIAQMAGDTRSAIEVAIPNGPILAFDASFTPRTPPWPWNLLGSDPPERPQGYGSWRLIDRVQEPGAAQARAARPGDDVRVRYFAR